MSNQGTSIVFTAARSITSWTLLRTVSTGWYKVSDEFPPTDPTHQWVLARDARRIPRAEMSPIHPFAGEKRIEVDLDKQRLTC